MKQINKDFARGYFCAVAVLLREEGCVTPQVRRLFRQGGDARLADEADCELFTEYGLLSHNEDDPCR